MFNTVPHIIKGDKFLGIDIARLGGDETVLVSLERRNREYLYMTGLTIPEGQRLTDTTRLILHRDKVENYKKIYIDDGGLGAGVFDQLHEDRQTKRKIIAINNARREVDKTGKNAKYIPLMKENLYNNLLNLMERGKIKLWDTPEVEQSLRSIQCEFGKNGLIIYGNYTHITEALIRAAWCIKDKSLNIYFG